MSYQPKIYKKDGGDTQVVASGGEVQVESGGELNIASGGTISAAGTQAANVVAAKTDYTAGDLDSEAEIIVATNLTNSKLNAVITALKGVGILASS